jgi:hypothetical protein
MGLFYSLQKALFRTGMPLSIVPSGSWNHHDGEVRLTENAIAVSLQTVRITVGASRPLGFVDP